MKSRRRFSRASTSVTLIALLAASVPASQEPKEGTLRSGEKLEVSLETPLSSRSSHVGDKVDATLTNDEVREGIVVLPGGSKLKGEVEAVQRADWKLDKRARLRLVFDLITLPNGQVLTAKVFLEQIGPEVSRERHASLKIAVATVAAMGAVGALIGLPINWPKGAGVGAAVGSGAGLLIGLATLGAHWEDVQLFRGQRILLQFDQNLVVHVSPSPKP